jgi:LPS export ABC transporter protein LptC
MEGNRMGRPGSSLKTLVFFPLLLFLGACSFDYGNSGDEEDDQPDIIMREVEYVRVREGEPTVRFQAQLAERYESRQAMELRNFSFEQFGSHSRGEDVNALGRAGAASVELDSGDIRLENGVRIEIGSEDITIETSGLDWQDEERTLTGGEFSEVNILRSDGTNFSGRGFSANSRNRTWEFSAGVEGSYTHEDDEEEAEEPEPEDGPSPEGEGRPSPEGEGLVEEPEGEGSDDSQISDE